MGAEPEGVVTSSATGKKKSARERFGAKTNPFAVPGQHVVGRSSDFRRIAALPRRTHWTDFSAAITAAFALPPRRPGSCPPRCPCGGTGSMQLRPRQGWALSEILQERGGIGVLGVGDGKTAISFLLPLLMGWKRAILFVPAGLRDKTLKIDLPALARHWRMPHVAGTPYDGPDNLEVRSYEELSRVSFSDYLEKRRLPDGIICDEVHYLKHKGSARTKRVLRYFTAFPETEFAGLSASLVHRSLMDYGHLTNLALKDTSPLPHSFIELKTWADVIDEEMPPYARPKPGALWDFCRIGETVRDGFRRRFLEAPGIISSPDLSTSIGLQVREIEHPPVPEVVVEAFRRLRNTAEMPDGEMCSTVLDQARHARELFLGFYLRWVWPGGVKDKEWLDVRKRWRTYVRKMTSRSHGGKWYDTEAQVANAIMRRELDGILLDDKTGKTYEVYSDWVPVREDRKVKWGSREPPKEVVWLSAYMLVALEKWAQENTGIVWIENIGFLDELRKRRTAGTEAPGSGASVKWSGHGCACYGAGENEIELEDGFRSVFASFAHKTGKNLQMFNRMCFSNPLSSGKAWEQALGREHRPKCMTKGVPADEVIADVFLGCRETWWSFERSKLDAQMIEATLGQPQRLNKATILSTGEEIVMQRCDSGAPLWAPTGHAKIDASLSKAGVKEDAFPILTGLRKQAKEEVSEQQDEDSEE